MVDREQFFKILGFAHRARKLTPGLSATLRMLSKGKLQAIILASDLGKNTKSEIDFAAKNAKVPVFIFADKDTFGEFFARKEVGVIGIADANFAKSICELMK